MTMKTMHEEKAKSKQDGLKLAVLESNKIRLTLCNCGAAIFDVEYRMPDGSLRHIVTGRDTPAAFAENPYNYGATVGRVANRIKDAELPMEDGICRLSRNEGKNHIHGGFTGFSHRIWEMEAGDKKPIPGAADTVHTAYLAHTADTAHAENTADTADLMCAENTADRAGSVLFTLVSPDGEEGYPGTLHASVRYTLTGGEILIEYTACADRDTVYSPTNHAYWCLGGQGTGIRDEILSIPAGRYVEVDDELIPTGRLKETEGTVFDFRTPCRLGDRLDAVLAEPRAKRGFDICYALDPGNAGLAARLEDPGSGLKLEVESSFPGIQLYTGNFLDDREGRNGVYFGPHMGVALECCAFPDTVHHKAFGSVRLRAGETWKRYIRYRIGEVGE